jgi:hypothetical protein
VSGGGTAEASGGRRFFSQSVAEREGSDWAVLNGSDTVVSQGFDWYMHQLETRTGRKRTEEDRAMRYGKSNDGTEKLLGRGRNKIKVIQNLCSDTMLREKLYIESHIMLYMRGLYI